MNLKPGVTLDGVRPEILSILPIIEQCYHAMEYDLTITCTTKGHPEGDPHPPGFAVDCRTHGLYPETQQSLAYDIQHKLGSDYFVQYEPQVVNEEGMVIKGEHIHVQVAKLIWHAIVAKEGSNG